MGYGYKYWQNITQLRVKLNTFTVSVVLKRVARDFGLRFEMDSSRQFAQRFANDLETIREAGFDVVISQKRYGTKLYTIQAID